MLNDAAATASDSRILNGRRVAVVLPADLVEAIDDAVGEDDRSAFIEEAARAKLRTQPVNPERSHERLRAALDEMAGSLSREYIPEWETRESATAWVRALRRGTLSLPDAITIDDCTS